MLWKQRFFAALLAAAAAAAIGAAVRGFTPERPGVSVPAAAAAGNLTLEAVGVAPEEIVLRVDGNEANAELLTYQIGYSCAYLSYLLQSSGRSDFDPEATLPDGERAADYVMDESLLMLKQQLVLENLCARYGVTLSDETEEAIAAQRQSYIDELGEEGYRSELYKLGISESGFDRLSRVDYLYTALYELYTQPGSPIYAGEEELRSYAALSGYITADHILIPTVDLGTRERLDEDTVAQNRALAEELLAQLRGSGDPAALFPELAARYSQDTGRASNPDGYTFTTGTMVDEFDGAARALKEGEISDIVESQYGYHIILRKPLDVGKAADQVREEYFSVWFNGEVDRAEHTVTEAAERFDVGRIYEALTRARGGE